MVILDHEIQMQSSRLMIERHEESERLDAWSGNNRMQMSRQNNERQLETQSWGDMELPAFVEISQEGMNRLMESINAGLPEAPLKTPYSDPMGMADVDDDEMALPPKLQMAKQLLEKFFGIEVEIVDMEGEDISNSQNRAPRIEGKERSQAGDIDTQEQGWGISYSYHEVHYKKEMVQFTAGGEVKTKDGREINFDIKMEMSRETFEEMHVEFRAGDALIDPLALNFDGKGVQLTDEKYEFDLDSDGQTENISMLQQGSGFLVLDKNGNGKVDNGSELFGPETNQGFRELKAYDSDGNNWIDEKDAVFYQLNLWTKSETGADEFATLIEKGVGAIYLESIETPLDLGQGRLRETGVYLSEDGTPNTIQEVDLLVEA